MAERFGRKFDDELELEFGEWGVLSISPTLDAFQASLLYFDREDIIKKEINRFDMVQAARRYYDGNHVKPLKVKSGQADDNVIMNLCRPLVDDGVSWLFGDPASDDRGVLEFQIMPPKPVAGEIGPDGEMQEEPEEKEPPIYGEPVLPDDEAYEEPEIDPRIEEAAEVLRKVLKKSGGFHLLKRLGVRGGVAGHFYLKIVPAPEDEQEDNEPPRIVVLDPNRCSVMLDPTDSTRVIGYKVEWRRDERPGGMGRKTTYIYRQLAVEADKGVWVVADFKSKDKKKRDWELVGGPWAWPYKWSPIADGPNVMPAWGYYGLSDLEDVAGMNDAINFVVSNYSRILKHHAHPKTVGTGFKAGDLVKTNVDSLWTIENPNAKVANLEMQTDLKSSMALIELLRTEFWSEGRGLDPSVYKDKIGTITNFGLRVLAVRALHNNSDKRQTYGEVLRQTMNHILEMAGFEGFDAIPQWPDPLPEDPKDSLDRAEKEIKLDLASRRTKMEELGRSWEQEGPRIRAEKKERMDLGQFLVGEFDKGTTPQPFGKKEEKNE